MRGTRAILLYDDHCYWCSTLAEKAFRFSRHSIYRIGHYSNIGKTIKERYFSPDDNPEEMFWLIRDDTCYGGRNGLIPLATEVIRGLLT